ncbi:MAG: aminotransferase class III-fold pyridoxal phosphate-dependent enzyme, partial [Bacteroidia bacterium]|nr:aminotransferase class III-fold pyridoxal phosphate-dependent enzyme [Bacteroidia bacterium]
MNIRNLFLNHVAQTSEEPMGFDVSKAEGVLLYDEKGKQYIDFIAGISVCSVGHSHPKIIAAIKEQSEKYLHTMVYGEHVQSPQVLFAKALCDLLPAKINSCYFTNSGSEATEGAIKLAKRVTGKQKIASIKNSYHGSTAGALSLMSDEYFTNAFRPLVPGTIFLDYNNIESIERIDDCTAAVVVELVKAETGCTIANKDFIQALAQKCKKLGALLIVDEIQTAIGRTGSSFAFEDYGIEPDVILLAKSLGGGLPLGAFLANQKHMSQLSHNPVLGHITTFGGNPLCCVAGHAALDALLDGKYISDVHKKEKLIKKLLVHDKIKAVHGKGLLLAVELENAETTTAAMRKCIANGLITDWFLFAPNMLRIAPPLIMDEKTIKEAC